jgi:hypothetical protein
MVLCYNEIACYLNKKIRHKEIIMNLRILSLITCLGMAPVCPIIADCCDCNAEQVLDFEKVVENRFQKGLEELEKLSIDDLETQKESFKKMTLEDLNTFEPIIQDVLHVTCRYLAARIERSLSQRHEVTWDDTTPSECELECKAAIMGCFFKHASTFIQKVNALTEKPSEAQEMLWLGLGGVLLQAYLNKIEKFGSLESTSEEIAQYRSMPLYELQFLFTEELEMQYSRAVHLVFDHLRAYKQRTDEAIPTEQELAAKAALIEWYKANARTIIARALGAGETQKQLELIYAPKA